MKISKRPGEELLFLCNRDGRSIMTQSSKLIIHSWSVLSHFVMPIAICNKIAALCNDTMALCNETSCRTLQ